MENPQISRIEILVEQDRWQEALDLTQNSLSQDPDNSYLWYLTSVCQLHLDLNEPAEIAIQKALSMEPDNEYYQFYYATIFYKKEDYKKAEEILQEIIAATPNYSDAWALLANIQLIKKKYNECVSSADMALTFEPENTWAINIRVAALTKLNLVDESVDSLEKALHDDPNNALTHANFGWVLLEKGQREKALRHFQESLAIDPNNENAQSGMKQALKAKYPLYNLFLKYSFFMSKLTLKNQWGVIIGYIILVRVIRFIGQANPVLEKFTTPLIYILALIAFSTWVINPLSNLFFRLNKYGKHLLSANEKRNANLVGIAALGFITGLVGLLVFHKEPFFMLAAVSFGLTPVFGKTFSKNKKMRLVKYYSLLMFIVGALAVYQAFWPTLQSNVFAGLFFIGFIAQTWVINFLASKANPY